jgi:hypothetical protein
MGIKLEIGGRTITSIHTRDGWCGQLDRLRRWHDRLHWLRSHRGDDYLSWEDVDFVLAVLQNCCILREWLVRDGAVGEALIGDFVSSHPELRVCRDIANGTKHFSVSRPSVDAEFSILQEYVPAPVGGGEAGRRFVVIAGDKYDMLALADRCVHLWERFISEHSLVATIAS